MPTGAFDVDDDPTRPETPDALLARAVGRFATAATELARAVSLLPLLDESEREYFAARLCEDLVELGTGGVPELVAAIRFANTR